MSTIKADNISPVGSILNLTAPVAGLSVASGLTVGGVAYFSGGATFAGVARFAAGVTFAGTTDHTGVARFAAGVTMSSSLDVNGTLKVGNFDGATNVMVKATNASSTVGQVIPLLTWGADIGSAHVPRNHTAPIPPGTWLVVLTGISDAGNTENQTLSMAQTWVVPSGNYLVFAHTHITNTAAAADKSGLAWKLINTSDVASYRTTGNDFPYTAITSGNGWNYISKTNGTAQLINEQNADTAGGGDRPASGCVYQGGGGWYVAVQVSGYAIRIA